MKTKEEIIKINSEASSTGTTRDLILETLLDIRDKLYEQDVKGEHKHVYVWRNSEEGYKCECGDYSPHQD